MIRFIFAAALVLLPFVAHAQTEQQTLVDRATLSVQEVMRENDPNAFVTLLKRSRAVMVCPRLFRAGFIIGGEGGGCVLVARDGGGSWSSPAFFGLGSGSVGFQIGVSDSQVIMMILTDRGLNAVLNSQFKFGADAQVAIATVGAGVEGSTTAALGADIVTWSLSRGLFAGAALEGSIMAARSEWNQAYYGREISPRQIVIGMEAHNPGADPLRQVLMQFGTP